MGERDFIVTKFEGIQLWEATFVELDLIQIVVLSIQFFKACQIKQLTEHDVIIGNV